jgi:hypothetical protein
MKWIIRLVDHILVRLWGIRVYWDDPKAMFRIRVIEAPHTLHLSDGEVPAGAPILELHFWNDRAPRMSEQGPDLAWGLAVYRMLSPSLRALARCLETDPELAEVQAVGGSTVLVSFGASGGAEKLFERLGLEIAPYQEPMGRFGRFWENFYTWALMWAYNDVSVRNRHMLELRRSDAWMSRAKFLRIHGQKEPKS